MDFNARLLLVQEETTATLEDVLLPMFAIVQALDSLEILVKFPFVTQYVLMVLVLLPIHAVVLEQDIQDLFVKFHSVMILEDV